MLDPLLRKSSLCLLAPFSGSVPTGRQDGWTSGLRPILLVITAEEEHPSPSVVGILVVISQTTALELVRGESDQFSLHCSESWEGFPREAGQAETPKCPVGRLSWRSWSPIKPTTSLFSKTLLFSWSSSPYTPPPASTFNVRRPIGPMTQWR